MKNIILLFALCSSFLAHAQYKTVNFNYERSYFNEGQPLPAQDYLMLNGEVSSDVQMVQLKIYRTSNTDKAPLHTALWKRPNNNLQNTFTLPINYKLNGSSEYTFVINYFQPASDAQSQSLHAMLEEVLFQYLEQSVQVKKRSITLLKNPKLLIKDMDQIVETSLSFYDNKNNFRFNGFSDIILSQLQQLENINLSRALHDGEGDMNKAATRMAYARKQIEGVKLLVAREITQFIDDYLMIITDNKTIIDYPTEHEKYTFAINAGYGGAYNDGGVDNFTYGSGVMLGLSFPLGRGSSRTGLNRLAISTGVFIQDFDFGDGKGATGPLVKRPYYLGLGIKTLKVVRLNAGAVVLQSTDSNKLVDFGKVYIRPYIGIAIELNLWLGF
ncbi:MAG: hypothetical protein WD048_12290 [Chitinophagales bacterium]